FLLRDNLAKLRVGCLLFLPDGSQLIGRERKVGRRLARRWCNKLLHLASLASFEPFFTTLRQNSRASLWGHLTIGFLWRPCRLVSCVSLNALISLAVTARCQHSGRGRRLCLAFEPQFCGRVRIRFATCYARPPGHLPAKHRTTSISHSAGQCS